MSIEQQRAAFEAALSKKPEALHWNTSDAMFWAWQAARKCDGNHGGPRCADPECWNDSPRAAIELDRQDQHTDAFERDHQKAVRAIEVTGIPEIQGLSPENAISTLAFMLDQQGRGEQGNAKKRYDEAMQESDETDAIERLRVYCYCAMSGQDWLDVEPFFDALTADLQSRGEPVDPHSEWTDYAKRSGLLNDDGIAPDPARAQTAWNAFSFSWNRSYSVNVAPQPAEPVKVPSVLVHQFRTSNCSDWYDGHPDYSDGGGPYETRTLYTTLPAGGQAQQEDHQ